MGFDVFDGGGGYGVCCMGVVYGMDLYVVGKWGV